MREHSPADDHVEAAARQIAAVMAETAPMPPNWNDFVAPSVDLENRRHSMPPKMVIALATGIAAALVVIAQVVMVRGGPDSDITTVVDQPAATTAPPTGDTEDLPPGTSMPQVPSSSTTTTTTLSELTIAPLEWRTQIVLDPTGGLIAVYWDEAEGSIKMQRCSDPECMSTRDIVTLGPAQTQFIEGEDYGPSAESIAFTPDGTPIVVMREGDGETFTIYACTDSSCESVLMSPFNETPQTWEQGINAPTVAVGGDQMPRVAYWDRAESALMLAVCGDLVCSPERRSTVVVDDDIRLSLIQISLQVLPDGRAFLGYNTVIQHVSHSAKVAVCSDDSCSNVPIIHTFERAVAPRVAFGEDGSFFVWYRSGPEMVPEGDVDPEPILRDFGLMVVECDDAGCDVPKLIESEWELLFVWGFDQGRMRMLQTSEQTFFVYAHWSSESCDYILEMVAFDSESGVTGPVLKQIEPYLLTGSVTENGRAVVVYQSDDTLHSIDLQADLLDNSTGPTAAVGGCQAD